MKACRRRAQGPRTLGERPRRAHAGGHNGSEELNHARSNGPSVRSTSDDRGRPDADTRCRRGARPGRDVGALPHRHPRRQRRLARATGTAVHPRPRGRRHRRACRRRRHPRPRGRPRRRAVARLGMRRLRGMRVGVGDALPERQVHRLHRQRRLCRLRRGRCGLRRSGAGRHRPARCRTAHLRRCHHLQGGQGLRGPFVGPRRRVRHRRARPPRDAVRTHRRRHGRSRRRRRGEARGGQAPRRRVHDQLEHARRGRGDAGTRWRRLRHRPGGLAARLRAGVRQPAPQRHPRARRSAPATTSCTCPSSRRC